ncbi:MAG TPA: 2TM domain-containing protein [Polyangiaceae bacterium]|nr:2TM domain-containing protein [Polyangiaceae bacterium]
MPDRTYTDAEVREILRRAVARGAASGGLGRQDLIEAARDVGIDASAVDAAMREVDGERDLNEELAKLKQERHRELASSVGTWAIVNAGLFAIDWANGGGWWFYWPLCTWGLALALRLKGVVLANPTRDQREAERRLEQRNRERERQQAEERRREQASRRELGRGIEGAIERGVQEIFSAAARRIVGTPGATEKGTGRPRSDGVRVSDPGEKDGSEARDDLSGRAGARQRR